MNKKEQRKYAIYSRKSKYTGKGESIENQIEMCRQHLRTRHNVDIETDIVVYEDEGFTGANTKRPQFQKMIKDIRANKISTVICYRLDRISRNVLDFCTLKDELADYDVSFISIKEDFDTSTPMGTAMLMICSVFAQLERDTIAERIRDNMLELAKTGRWLGGTTPTGYKSEAIESVTLDGKKRKLFKLSPEPEEEKIVKLIYDKFYELKTLTKLETYFIQKNIKSKRGGNYSSIALRNILTNPVYANADEYILEYCKKNNMDIFAEAKQFNGEYGMMVYNKTIQQTGKATKPREMEKWIVAIGKHKGFVSGEYWVQIQSLLEKNTNQRYRRPTANTSILSGLLRCKHCNSFMRPKLDSRTIGEENRKFRYMCEMKEKSRRQKCTCPNANGDEVDRLVLEAIKNAIEPNNKIYQYVKKMATGAFESSDKKNNELNSLTMALKQNEATIRALIEKLALVSADVVEDITNEIKRLKEANTEINQQICALNGDSNQIINDTESASLVLSILGTFHEKFDVLDLVTKRMLLRLVVSSIHYDGEEIIINFHGARNISDSEQVLIPSAFDRK